MMSCIKRVSVKRVLTVWTSDFRITKTEPKRLHIFGHFLVTLVCFCFFSVQPSSSLSAMWSGCLRDMLWAQSCCHGIREESRESMWYMSWILLLQQVDGGYRKYGLLFYSWKFFPESSGSHSLLWGHVTAHNETDSRQNLWAGNIATFFDVRG